MILTVIALLLSSFLIMLSDIKRTMPDSFITMDEAKDLDIYIFSSKREFPLLRPKPYERNGSEDYYKINQTLI